MRQIVQRVFDHYTSSHNRSTQCRPGPVHPGLGAHCIGIRCLRPRTSEIIETPFRAPTTSSRGREANAYAERWLRSAPEECLLVQLTRLGDHILVLCERHLDRVMRDYDDYYNRARPHHPVPDPVLDVLCQCVLGRGGIQQQIPLTPRSQPSEGSILRRRIPGGIIHNYRQPLTPASSYR